MTLLALHHPPFATGVGWMDDSGFVGLDRLEAVLAEHPVDKVVCGHFHRSVSAMISGIPVQVGLATVQHVDLDLAPGAGVSLIVDPIGYQIHRIAGSSVVTHTRFIETGAPAHRPVLGRRLLNRRGTEWYRIRYHGGSWTPVT